MMLGPLNLKHLNRIDSMDADMITLNLEDAIAPSRKKEALINIALFLSHMKSSKSFIIVRTNPLGEGGEEEIAFLNPYGFDALRLPKVTSQLQVAQALTLLDESKELHLSIETKEAFGSIAQLRIDPRVSVANLGILDLLSSLALPQSLIQKGNPTIDYILSKFLVECKSVGIHPISFMYQDYEDTYGFSEWCEQEKMMGYTTKACMGPAQVEIANRIFKTTHEDIARATQIKESFEANAAKGINGFMDKTYGFIDEPIYKDALLVLASSEETR